MRPLLGIGMLELLLISAIAGVLFAKHLPEVLQHIEYGIRAAKRTPGIQPWRNPNVSPATYRRLASGLLVLAATLLIALLLVASRRVW